MLEKKKGKKYHLIKGGAIIKRDIVMVEGAGVAEQNLDFSIYPNPATDNVVVNAEAGASVAIYSLTGGIVASGVSNKTINVSELSAGIYQVVVTMGGVQSTQKLVIR